MDKEQEAFFNILKNEIESNHISQAYLIELGNYTEIDYFIKKMAKYLLCPNYKDNNNCDCNICNLIESNNYPDLKIIDIDGNFIKKEQLIDVKDTFSKKSIFNNKQIYVIKDASKLNQSSGNTMLKFLEEPDDDIIAILLASNRYSVLETIVSRCRVFKLNDPDTLTYSDKTEELVMTLFSKNKGFLVFNDIIEIVPDKLAFVEEIKIIQRYLFDVVNNKTEIINDLKYLTNDNIYKIIIILEKYLARCEYNVNYKLLLDDFLIAIEEVIK